MKPDYNYRPNPARALYITSSFNEKLAIDLLPIIMGMRVSNDPITVYLNSNGGSISVLNTIHGSLSCRDADGSSCRIITVGLGGVASAAASMLVLGDYAICHQHTTLHFHGARLSDIDAMTMEHASNYAARLAALNANNALQMAKRVIGRIVRRYVQLLPKITEENQNNEVTLDDFVSSLKNLTSVSADRVIDRTMMRIKKAQELSDKVLKKAKIKKEDKLIKQDVSVLKSLIDHIVRVNNHEGFRLDNDILAEITQRYSLMHDYQLGEHYRSMTTVIRKHSPYLLSKEELEEFEKLKLEKDIKEQTRWLYDKNGMVLHSLWHFAVVLCRELQAGENQLSSTDVYWMGCIDEVIGSSRLLGARADSEHEITTEELPTSV